MDDKEEIKQVVVYGEKAIEPRTPEKVGYDFVGWYHNDERYDFDAPVKSNIKLEPRWVLSDDTTYSISIFAEINGVYVDVSEKYTNIFEGLKGTTGNVINITELVKETIPSNYTLNPCFLLYIISLLPSCQFF